MSTWTGRALSRMADKCPLGNYGYSRDHRPDKKQITVGLSELSSPINVPIGMTVREGNVNDQVHFEDTFGQVKDRLREGSMVVFDEGGNRTENLDRIENSKLKFLTARQLNKSDESTWIKDFDKFEAELLSMKGMGCTASKSGSRAGSTICSSLTICTGSRLRTS